MSVGVTGRPDARRGRVARAPTIREVAREAGVGIGTVSRALGAGELVRPSTRERVRAAAERVGYRPSRAARLLRGAPGRVLGVMIPDLTLPLYGHWLRGAGEAAREHGYVLLVCDGQNSRHVIEQQVDRLYGDQIDGLVVAGSVDGVPGLERFLDAGVPVVPEIKRQARRGGRRKLPREVAELSAARAAFGHLVALGHRRIAYFAHVQRDVRVVSPMQQFRIRCLRDSVEAAGAAFDARLVVPADGPDECRARLRDLLAQGHRPTAFVPGTEALTPAVLAGLTASGLRIPADASVIGFGDSLWEQAFCPPISVVRLDFVGVGRAMVENVIARIEGVQPAPRLPAFPSEFVSRGSCAAPPAPRRRRA